ncbi:MAG: DUF4854 domain-containing protein [Mogibacterium sp.]|nr:DUF4854 domain-containing protein [Mogibacterium sp.]
MKKNSRILALLLVAVLSVCAIMTGCSKKTPTLEDYFKDHPDQMASFEESFASNGLDGTVEVKENDIIMTVDITSALGSGITLDDSTKQLLQSSFDSAFDQSEAKLASSIAGVEEETGIKGITVKVIVVYDGETVYERSFTA